VLDVLWDPWDALDISSLMMRFFMTGGTAQLREIAHEVIVNDGEIAGEDATGVDVGRVWFAASARCKCEHSDVNKNKDRNTKCVAYSLLPRICEVEAVGIGATRRVLRRPCLAMFSPWSVAQSHLSDGVTPHMSGWRMDALGHG
jgi:hypothetical protein